MQTASIVTIVKMVESLPESIQSQVVDHLRDYIVEIQYESQWDQLVEKTQPKLIEAAQRARYQIAEGKATPFDLNEL